MGVITSFLRRSACSLRSFSVMFTIYPPYFDIFMGLLQSMPSLNTLSITTKMKNTSSKDYNPQNIFQLVAKVLSSQSAPLQQGFLPNLEILKYTGKLHLRPGNYDDLYPFPLTDNAVHGPLHLLKFNLHSATHIPQNMISYISSLAERGVAVNVLSKSEDILQSSIDHYRVRKDPLCWDWADNLDLSLLSSLVEREVAVNALSKSEDRVRKDSFCWDWADNLDLSLLSSLVKRRFALDVLSKSDDRDRRDSSGSDWADNLDLTLLSSLVERGVAANVLSKSEDILQSSKIGRAHV